MDDVKEHEQESTMPSADEAVPASENSADTPGDGVSQPVTPVVATEPPPMPAVPADWQLLELPEWLDRQGERYLAHRSERARLYRYFTTWDDGSRQEMWSVYVSSPDVPDAVCVHFNLALSMYERFKNTKFMPKNQLIPWRT